MNFMNKYKKIVIRVLAVLLALVMIMSLLMGVLPSMLS